MSEMTFHHGLLIGFLISAPVIFFALLFTLVKNHEETVIEHVLL